MRGELIPFGYSTPHAEQHLALLMRAKNVLLIDCRYSPRSRFKPEWNRRALLEKYGDRYRFAGDLLGNIHYNNDLPMQLANKDVGIQKLVDYLLEGYTLIILCTCKEYALCHRKMICDFVQEQLPDIQIMFPTPRWGLVNGRLFTLPLPNGNPSSIPDDWKLPPELRGKI